ncbi:hypothetical protein PPTG_10165 [Phytophthora nicotianae INRA-310]|uniref:Transposase Tc1-like domain-containing protein n=1 Tax=Phytophthora nicotianae (strain INRA-310) TaxID=761204 RepID=W2QDE5_PHYN3|nr:hypothetical protein PPTG_10165 [Phytophthora nicotianae INRA-310]ETN11218.1 hypothetical protein PPTG_10165 [Phytophthora nicotianae INRA-310]
MGNLTDVQRRAIVNDLLFSCRDGKVPHGTCLAKDYGCHWHSIKRIWNRYRENVALGIADGAPESRIKGNLGRKPYDRSELAAKLKEVPIFERHRVAATTARIGVSASLIRALLDEGHLTRRLRRIKPLLSDDNKIQRMKHTLTFIDEQTYQFENMYGMVHIDEKRTSMSVPSWFSPTKNCQSATAEANDSSPRLCFGQQLPARDTTTIAKPCLMASLGSGR